MKKILIGLILTLVLLLGIYFIFLNSQRSENTIIGGTLDTSDSVSIEISNFKKFKLLIKIDKQESIEKLNVQIVDPTGNIATTFDVTDNNEKDFNFDNIKGTWKVVFTKSNEDGKPYTYGIKYDLKN